MERATGEQGMNSRHLRAAVAAWLRYKKQAPVVAFERGIGAGIPDVMAITKDRFLLEVEIKISMADFRRDKAKDKWRWRSFNRDSARDPAYFYYAVPREMVEKIRALIPEGTGIITMPNPETINGLTGVPGVESVVAARRRQGAKRLRLIDCVDMVRHQTGTLVSLECEIAARQMTPENWV